MKKEGKVNEVPSGYVEEYPYGTRLSFDKEFIEKINFLKDVKAGDAVNGEWAGSVIEVRKVDAAKDKNNQHSIEIQVEKISIDSKSEEAEGFKDKSGDE